MKYGDLDECWVNDYIKLFLNSLRFSTSIFLRKNGGITRKHMIELLKSPKYLRSVPLCDNSFSLYVRYKLKIYNIYSYIDNDSGMILLGYNSQSYIIINPKFNKELYDKLKNDFG